MSKHLYVCPACRRTFELSEGEPIPDHADRPSGCAYRGPATRLSFTLEEARRGVQVAVLVANVPAVERATAELKTVHLRWVEAQSDGEEKT